MPSSSHSSPPSSPLSPLSPSPASPHSAPLPAPTLTPSTYAYTPTELHVFSSAPSLAPYKAALLPLWRFRTPAVAHTSATALWARFLAYDAAGDFVGMDMARKYLQMGMTRARRYANYKGGRKYVRRVETGEKDGEWVGGARKAIGKSEDHKGKAAKEEVSRVFREVWERAKGHEGYVKRKEAWLAEQRSGDKERKRANGVGKDGAGRRRRKRDTVNMEGE